MAADKDIEPHLGGVQVGKLSTSMTREWRVTLLAGGVSVSVAAKAYWLLRAVLMTAVDEDKILPHKPLPDPRCRYRARKRAASAHRGAGLRPGRAGRAPTGRQHSPDCGYRLRFRRHGEMRSSPERYGRRAEAEHALRKMASEGRAASTYDRRFYALVLLATFSSLRWGEVTALRRCDLDLGAGTVRIRAAYVERSTGEMLLGPPKSKAGRRIVGIPAAIVPALREHLAIFARDEPGALVFPGVMGGPLRRGNFNQASAWPQAVASIGLTGLHFHDLRHTGNTLAGDAGASLRELMDRMGHSTTRAALIYQHRTSLRDKMIADEISRRAEAERPQSGTQRARDNGEPS